MAAKSANRAPDGLGVLWTKVALYFCFAALVIAGYILAPKVLATPDQVYDFSAGLAQRSNDNLVLYNYKVYATTKRFEDGIKNDIPLVRDTIKGLNEVLVAKVHGTTHREEFIGNYTVIYDPAVPELNIEYYVANNLTTSLFSLPCKTFIVMAQDIMSKGGIIYNVLLGVVAASLLIPPCIGLGRNVPLLVKTIKGKKETAQAES